ncbi:MAG: hypothetical protein NC548_34820 [Lachnospiraceae bacterium]|nr:hypothetical protein [Lachnospiraceae bacterium]
MTFDEYITNPMGRSNAVLSAAVREAQRNIYTNKFNNILLRENGKIDYFLYKGKGSTYFIHIKIPSEVVKNFYYDVVIKFVGDAKKAASFTKLDKYDVQFFSNDPAFVYNYTYVFGKKGLFINELSKRMDSKALHSPAKEKNPDNTVGYVKSIYFAYLFMKQRGLFTLSMYDAAPIFDQKYLLSQVMDADKKIELRQELGAKEKKKKDISNDTHRRLKSRGVSDDSMGNLRVQTTKKVGVINNKAGNISKTKKTNKVKKSQKL